MYRSVLPNSMARKKRSEFDEDKKKFNFFQSRHAVSPVEADRYLKFWNNVVVFLMAFLSNLCWLCFFMAKQTSLFDSPTIIPKVAKPPPRTSSVVAPPVVMSVEDLNRAIRGTLERSFDLVWVQAEISNFKAHTSGHFYFSLKDSKAQVKAVMFRGFNSRLKFRPEDGLEVLVRGKVSVYEPRGEYQITVELMEPVGAGALQKAFEQLKAKLLSEGLFDSSRKRSMPRFPRRIALVTSPTGAAIRDMLNILGRRNPNVEIIIVPTLVQGAGAAEQIRKGLQDVWQLSGLDLIIVGRGGGSIEDLWAFNDEALARTIAASPVPVISAVGHEIDFTIADFVADLRAPTPSAAAELAVPDVVDLSERVNRQFRLLQVCWKKLHQSRAGRLQLLGRQLVDPRKRLQDLIFRNDELLDRLIMSAQARVMRLRDRISLQRNRLVSPEILIARARQNVSHCESAMKAHWERSYVYRQGRLSRIMGLLDALSPLKTLERGYAIPTRAGAIVRRPEDVSVGDQIEVQIHNGWIEASVTGTRPREV